MATILNNAPYMGFPLSIKRGNPAPVDTTAVWYDKTELETYAASGATAYVGQILTLVADSKCEAYVISNEAGTLIKLASTTASGDLASDVATLQGQVADLIAAVGKKAADGQAATGIYKDIEDVNELAKSKITSIDFLNHSLYADNSDPQNPKLSVAIAPGENALEITDAGLQVTIPTVDVPEYTIKQKTLSTEEAEASPYAAIYQLMKGDTQAGVDINIPKDMVVQSGTVETFYEGALPEGVDQPGTYIVLILANTGSKPLYIPVSSLVDVYTGTPTEDKETATVLINVDPTTHVITASVRNGSVTKAMLSTEVQGLLGKAGSAVQTIETGSANGSISVDGEDVAVKGLADAAYVTVASLNTTAKGYADAAKTAIIGNADTDTADSQTLEGVKKYAHGQAVAAQEGAEKAAEDLVKDLNVTDAEVATQLVSAVSQSKGKITVSRRALVAADIPELAQSKISGLETALAGKQDNITFDGTYNTSTNKAATVSTVNAIVTNGSDTLNDDTIKGAKLYADSKASAAETAAKQYADGLVTGDTGITKRVEALETKVDVDKVSTAISTADEAVKSALIGTTADTKDSDTIEGAKKYADSKASANKTLIDGIDERVTANATAINGKASTTALNSEIDRAEAAEKANADALSGYKTTNDAAVAEAKKAGTDAADAVTALANGQVATNKTNIENLQTQIGGLTGAMHFKGSVTALPTEGDYSDGDVILISTTNKEYVYDSKTGTTIQEHWVELGDEGSYALKDTKINNKPLSSDITLTAADVGAEAAGNINKAINALSTDAVGGKGYYIQAIAQTSGKISANAVAMPTALKNPNALTFGSKSYDGSATAEITATDLGALTEITTTANGGLKVTDKNKIDIDASVTFILNGGTSAD